MKFDQINLELTHENSSRQEELEKLLKKYYVELCHLGTSYYNYGERIYQISNGKLCFRHSFEKKSEERNISKGQGDRKLEGNPMLSPYGYWSLRIQLSKGAQPPVTNLYNTFKGSTDQIEVHLVGHGSFVSEESIKESLRIEEYYPLH